MSQETLFQDDLFSKLAKNIKDNFGTENSKDVSKSDITYLLENVKSSESIISINSIINDINKSIEIEKGIFEYALVYCTIGEFDRSIMPAIYDDKFQDIILNLDQNSYIENKTFLQVIQNDTVNLRLIPFFSPSQIHPENWISIVEKYKYRIEAENYTVATDLYKCAKCGERKCTVAELQMRSADEPTNKLITCLVCYKTFIK
jgi:transcription elongation factor S-II